MNSTLLIEGPRDYVSTIKSATVACMSAAAAAGFWVYQKLVTDPLRIFYFVGPVWSNAPPAEICYDLTGVKAAWWEESPDRAQQCMNLLNRKFGSFDATVMTTLYFTIVTFILMQTICRCFFIRPIIRELRVDKEGQ